MKGLFLDEKHLYFRKNSSSHLFLLSSYFHTHPVTLLPQILGGRMHGPSPRLTFWGNGPPSPPMSPPMVRPAVQLLAGVEDHRNNFYLKQRKFQKWVCHLNSNHQCIGYSGFRLRIHSYVRQVGAVQQSSFTLYSTASSKPRGIPLSLRSPGGYLCLFEAQRDTSVA